MNTLIDSIRKIVGPEGLLTGDDVTGRSDTWPPRGGCKAKCIVRPIENTVNDEDTSSIAPPRTQTLTTRNNSPIGMVPTSRFAVTRRRPSAR